MTTAFLEERGVAGAQAVQEFLRDAAVQIGDPRLVLLHGVDRGSDGGGYAAEGEPRCGLLPELVEHGTGCRVVMEAGAMLD